MRRRLSLPLPPLFLRSPNPKTESEVCESGCRFKFDYGKVYWNSRLQGEHARLLQKLSPEDVLCDMFAGVGPFAVPAAKKGLTVYGNDLNPDSYKAMLANAKLNKVSLGPGAAWPGHVAGFDLTPKVLS